MKNRDKLHPSIQITFLFAVTYLLFYNAGIHFLPEGLTKSWSLKQKPMWDSCPFPICFFFYNYVVLSNIYMLNLFISTPIFLSHPCSHSSSTSPPSTLMTSFCEWFTECKQLLFQCIEEKLRSAKRTAYLWPRYQRKRYPNKLNCR